MKKYFEYGKIEIHNFESDQFHKHKYIKYNTTKYNYMHKNNTTDIPHG